MAQFGTGAIVLRASARLRLASVATTLKTESLIRNPRSDNANLSASASVGNTFRLPYVYRVPLCRPFWSWRTYAALTRCIGSGRVVSGPDVQRLEEKLAMFFSTSTPVACNSGRAALELGLRATGVGAGDEVIVPTFCCASIVPPIVAVEAVPVLADVGKDLTLTSETVEAAITSRTRAVVVAHLFGNPAPIRAIEVLCRERGLILIDDAAQALGARLKGRLLGTFGDAGIVSFGNGKVCFGVGGGALVSRHNEVLERARTAHFSPAAAVPTLKRAAAVTVWRRWRRWSLPLQVTLSRVYTIRQESAYAGRAMANLDAAVATSLLDTLDANIAARRSRVDAYRALLGHEAACSLLPHTEGSACLTQLVSFHGGEHVTIAIVRALRDAGYEVDRSYRPLHLQPPYEKHARSALPNADRIWPSLVELPCEPTVEMDDVRRVAEIVRATAGT